MKQKMPRSARKHVNPSPKRRLGCFTRAMLISLTLFAMLIFTGIGLTLALASSSLTGELEAGIDQLASARDRHSFETTRITDRNGNLLWEIFGEGNRTIIPLAQMPVQIKAATISVEDDTFYTNKGFDEPSLLAAVFANFRNPESRPIGGSTITQQIVRHIAFDYNERVTVSYKRKLKELFLAWRMTKDFSKDEILEMYLNEIYYGNLAYGIEAATQTYFDKSAIDLTLGEATLLAGLPQAPIALNPFINLEAAKARQWFILNLMLEDGMVNREQMDAAYLEELQFATQEVSLNAPHFAIEVRRQLEAQFGAEVVANGGLRVTTTLDLRYQHLAEQLAQQHIAALSNNNVTNAALVAMQPTTGEVLAMLGSVDYANAAIDGQVNVALTPQQPGSSFKPLTFALALQSGWHAEDVLWDVPISYPQLNGNLYQPVNYDGRFHGPMRLREALANSYNIPALILADAVGVENLLQFSRSLGLDSLVDDLSLYGISLTLGGGEVTQLEMTQAYSALANGGSRIDPSMILQVKNSRGEVLFVADSAENTPLISPEITFIISDMLSDDAARLPAMGRDNPLELPFTAAAKTGTTNDFRDNWTIGYTPGLVVSVWTGNSDNSPMVDVSGLSGAAPLWNAFMQAVYADDALAVSLQVAGVQPPSEFMRPNTLTQATFCDLDSIEATSLTCQQTTTEWIITAEQTELPATTTQREYLEKTVVKLLSAPLPLATGEAARPPLYCAVSEGRWPDQTEPHLFITRPQNATVAGFADQWARENGVMLEPQTTCDGALISSGGAWTPTPSGAEAATPIAAANATPTAAATAMPIKTATPLPTPIPPTATPVTAAFTQVAGATYGISSPWAGQTLNTATPIMGSAEFDPAIIQFYKVEIRKVSGGDWVSIGDTHNTPVTQGFLEILPVDGLLGSAEWGAGDYFVRLVLVKWDGNHAGTPFVVPVTLGG